MDNNFDTIIKERMLRNLKKAIADKWGCGDDGEQVLRELYLTERNSNLPENYCGDDVLLDIQNLFYFFLGAVRDEFEEPFIEVHVMPCYDDATDYFIILGDRLLVRGAEKAWQFWFKSEEELMDKMYSIYLILLMKTEKTYECYTLMDADIRAVADREGLSLDGIDLDDVIHYVKKGIEAALDNRDEIIEEAIEMAGSSRFEKMGCQ